MVLVSCETHASLQHPLFLQWINHLLAREWGGTEAGMELSNLPVPVSSRLWEWWGESYSRAKLSRQGHISLQEMAPHVREFFWPHQLVLADWLLFQHISFAKPRGSEADAPVKTGMSQSNKPSPSCRLKLLQSRNHPVLFFAFNPYSQLIPFLEPLRREPQNHPHGMGALEGTRKHLPTPSFHHGDQGPGDFHSHSW